MANDKDSIMTRLLANISDDYDKSEGSFFYDVEKPIAIELADVYTEIDAILDKRFADTATGTDLDRVVSDEGITREGATYASGPVTITGVEGSAITKGEYVASSDYKFTFTTSTVIPSGGTIDVTAQCTTAGTVGNVKAGTIKYFPKTLTGLTAVTNPNDFTNGTSAETDEKLRERYYTKVQETPASGNDADYKEWALSVSGCSGANVIPLWNGGGTVKVVIVNSDYGVAGTDLINSVQTYIDTKKPIGANVTVVSAITKTINITVSLDYDSTATTTTQIISNIKSSVSSYLKQLIVKGSSSVSYAKIGALIFNITGVNDYSNLLVNGDNKNITIASTEIPSIGTVNNA